MGEDKGGRRLEAVLRQEGMAPQLELLASVAPGRMALRLEVPFEQNEEDRAKLTRVQLAVTKELLRNWNSGSSIEGFHTSHEGRRTAVTQLHSV